MQIKESLIIVLNFFMNNKINYELECFKIAFDTLLNKIFSTVKTITYSGNAHVIMHETCSLMVNHVIVIN